MDKLTKQETADNFRKLSEKYGVLDYYKSGSAYERFYLGKLGPCKPLFLAYSRAGWVCVYIDKTEKVLLVNNGFPCERVTSGDERYEYKSHIDYKDFDAFLKLVKDCIYLKPSKLYKGFKISSDEKINDLISKVNNDESIALDLISLFGDESFENDLYEEAFKYLENIINSISITKPQRLCIVVALSFIALKYYDGDYYSHFKEKANSFFERTDYANGRIQNAIYAVLADFRPKMKYEDQKSYVAVPVIMSCAPHYRVFDLFKLSYDIYKKKLLFDEDISDKQIFSKVKETLGSIKEKRLIDYSDNSDRIKGTNYLMSKYTQSCIYSGVELTSLISIITDCIRLIISHITLSHDSFEVGEYYLQGFNQWVELFESDENERTRYEQSKAKTRPSLSLENYDVNLKTGEIEFDDSLDPNEVHILLYCDGNLVEDYSVADPDSIEYMDPDDALGGYVLRQCTILLSCNPLHNLQYVIEVSGQEIYNSGDKLYRSVAFFEGKGKEIKPGKEYDGDVFVLSKYKNDDEYGDTIHTIREEAGYYLSIVTVNSSDVFIFDGEPFVFYRVDGAKSLSHCIPWAEFESMEKRLLPIYSSALFLFQASCNIEDISILIDNNNYKYNDTNKIKFFVGDPTSTVDDNRVSYFQLLNLESGYHRVNVINDITGKEIKGASFEFVIDNAIDRKRTSVNADYVEMLIESDFIDNQLIKFDYGTPKVEVKAFVKRLGHGTLHLYPDSVSYSYDDQKWCSVYNRLMLYDVDDSVNQLSFCGPNNLKAYYYYSNADIETREANLRVDNDCPTLYHLSLDYLRSNASCRDISFVGGNFNQCLKVEHLPRVKVNECRFYHNDEVKEYRFRIVIDSKKEVYAIVKDRKSGKQLFGGFVLSGDEIALSDKDIPATVQYVSVSLHAKKSNGLFSNYETVSFHTFGKFKVERFFFSVVNSYTKINYIKAKRILTLQFNLSGDKSAVLKIEPADSDSKGVLLKKKINSGEIINVDATLWPFTSVSIMLFPTELTDLELLSAKPIYSDTYRFESLFLNKTFFISDVISDTGEHIRTGYNLSIMRVEVIAEKYCLICKLFNKKNSVTIFDVIFIPQEIEEKKIVGFICKRTINGFASINLGKTTIAKVLLDRDGGSYE